MNTNQTYISKPERACKQSAQAIETNKDTPFIQPWFWQTIRISEIPTGSFYWLYAQKLVLLPMKKSRIEWFIIMLSERLQWD